MAKKYLELNSGVVKQKEATVTSAGAANAGDIPALDGSGRLDVTVLPVGVGPDVKSLVAFEAIAKGKYVNIFVAAGTTKIRLADNSNGRDAHGYVKAAVAMAATGVVFFEGPNTDLSGLTPGGRVYLGTAGGVTQTPPVAPAANISQFLGIAVDVAEVNTDIDDAIGLV